MTTCSQCGEANPTIDDTYRCTECGLEIPRSENAAWLLTAWCEKESGMSIRELLRWYWGVENGP